MKSPLATAISVGAMLACGAVACSSSDSLQITFELPDDDAATIPLHHLPYPSDLHRFDVNGSEVSLQIDASSIRWSAGVDPNAAQHLQESLAESRCFGITGGVIFQLRDHDIGDPIDAEAIAEDAYRIIDLDTQQEIPARISYRELEGQLFVEPIAGLSFDQARHYAVWVTTTISTRSGVSLDPSPGFARVLHSDRPRYQAAYAPLATYLDDHTIDPQEIAAATVFTTCLYGNTLARIDAQLDRMATPVARIDRVVRSGDELDAILGLPIEPHAGNDNPGGVVHDAIGTAVWGHFDSPNYQSDTPNLLGLLQRDADDEPLVQGTDSVPFLLVLPTEVPETIPVVVFQHGINGTKGDVLTVGNTLARHGLATIGIDIPFHGERYPNARDVVHNFTSEAGPDGLVDLPGPTAAALFFNLIGDSTTDPIDPRVTVASFLQAATDLLQLSRVVTQGTWTELETLAPDLSPLRFDDRMTLSGVSFGSIISFAAFALGDAYHAAFFTDGGGGLVSSLLENSPEYGPLFLPIVGGAFDIAPSDIQQGIRPPRTHEVFNWLGSMLDEADPLAYAEAARARGKHIAVVTAFADEVVPNQSSERLATALALERAPISGSTTELHYAPAMDVAALPVEGNRSADGRPYTAAFVQLGDASHGMIMFRHEELVYEPFFPPYQRRPAPLAVDNPTGALQTMLARFARTALDDGVAALEDHISTL